MKPLAVPAYRVPAAAGGAVRFSANTQYYTRSAAGHGASPWTWAAWVKIVTDRNTYSAAMSIDKASTGYVAFQTAVDGTTMRIESSSPAHNIGALTVGTWYFIAFVFTDGTTDHSFIMAAGGGSTTQSADFNSTAMDNIDDTWTLRIGQNIFGDWFNGSIAAVKIWTAALTKTEIDAEVANYSAIRTANLWANYKFDAGPSTTDSSGNGRTLTTNGTPTLDSSGPPIAA